MSTILKFSQNNKRFAYIKYFDIKYQFVREKIHKHHTCCHGLYAWGSINQRLRCKIFHEHVTKIILSMFMVMGV